MIIDLLNPPSRTISVEQLRKMRSLKRETEQSMRRLSREVPTVLKRDD